jgi:hypothetical protein
VKGDNLYVSEMKIENKLYTFVLCFFLVHEKVITKFISIEVVYVFMAQKSVMYYSWIYRDEIKHIR